MEMLTQLKLAIKASPPFSDITLRGTGFDVTYSISDMNVWLDFENDGYIDSDKADQVLDKPTLIIFQSADVSRALVEDALVVAELQILVNHPGGRPALDGYTQLCQHILNEEESFLRFYGFVPRQLRITPVRTGEAITPNLKGRLLTRSLIAHLSYFGG